MCRLILHDPESASAGACLIVALTLAFGAWVATGLGGAVTTRAFDDLATVAAVVATAALCARAATQHEGHLRLHWWLLAAGCTAWALGEVIWSVYDLSYGSVPATSVADIAYLAALPPVAAALLVHPALRGRTIGKTRALVDGLALAAALSFAVWSLILEPPIRLGTSCSSSWSCSSCAGRRVGNGSMCGGSWPVCR